MDKKTPETLLDSVSKFPEQVQQYAWKLFHDIQKIQPSHPIEVENINKSLNQLFEELLKLAKLSK